MDKISTLVIGGCKSGKSRHALDLANGIINHAGQPGTKTLKKKIFVATSVPTDAEMEERVFNHKKERGSEWLTIEEPVLLSEVVDKYSKAAGVILIDCLTLWISNLLFKGHAKEDIFQNIRKTRNAVKGAECSVILVSNEVGAGIVPENKLARLFRDIAGIANQEFAEIVDNVVWTVAGIPVTIK